MQYLGLLLFVSPAIFLGLMAQMMVRSAYGESRRLPARLSGYKAARAILNASGLDDVEIEQSPGYLSDHYDARFKTLRLSEEVYHGRTLAAVGIAAHEAGHAIQHGQRYLPLAVRNAAVPAASFGSSAGLVLLILGAAAAVVPLMLVGIVIFSGVVFFQVINLPVELDASRRAKRQLVELGIVREAELPAVNRVLNAAALTYVAATLQSILTLLYYVLRLLASRQRR